MIGAATPLPEVLQFMQLLWAVAHGLEARSKQMAREFGVTGPQRLVLRVVGLNPGVSAGAVAQVLHIHPSTLTGILQRLVAQRLIARVPDPVDRRRAVLRLTSRGHQANSLGAGTVEAAVAQALTTITQRDRLATHRVLTSLAACLGRDEEAVTSAPLPRRRAARATSPRSPRPARS